MTYLYFAISRFLILVLRKKGSKTKKRMKEEEIEKGDCGPPTRTVFSFWDFVGLEPTEPNHLADESQTRQPDTPPDHPPVVYPANVRDEHMQRIHWSSTDHIFPWKPPQTHLWLHHWKLEKDRRFGYRIYWKITEYAKYFNRQVLHVARLIHS